MTIDSQAQHAETTLRGAMLSQNPASRRRIGQQVPTPPRRGKKPVPPVVPTPAPGTTPTPADSPPA